MKHRTAGDRLELCDLEAAFAVVLATDAAEACLRVADYLLEQALVDERSRAGHARPR